MCRSVRGFQISVSMLPGSIAIVLIPQGRSSTRRLSLIASSAYFDAA